MYRFFLPVNVEQSSRFRLGNHSRPCFFLRLSFAARPFTVLFLFVRSSRSSALRYGLPSCISVKTTQTYSGSGGGLGLKREKCFSRPPPTRAIIPVACPSVRLKITMATINGKTRAISRLSHEKIGDCEQSICRWTFPTYKQRQRTRP